MAVITWPQGQVTTKNEPLALVTGEPVGGLLMAKSVPVEVAETEDVAVSATVALAGRIDGDQVCVPLAEAVKVEVDKVEALHAKEVKAEGEGVGIGEEEIGPPTAVSVMAAAALYTSSPAWEAVKVHAPPLPRKATRPVLKLPEVYAQTDGVFTVTVTNMPLEAKQVTGNMAGKESGYQ